MKIVSEQHQMLTVACGTACDRCGAVQKEDREYLEGAPVPQPESEHYITVTVDEGRNGDVLRGHFCAACDQALRCEPGGWLPHLRQITHYMADRSYRCYRFEVLDVATGQRRRMESLFEETDLI